jgi:hypothetical protein
MKRFFQTYDAEFDAKLEELEIEKREAGLDWDIVASPFIERPQIIQEDPHPAEAEYMQVRQEIDEKYMVPFEGFLAGEESYKKANNRAQEIYNEQLQVAKTEDGSDLDWDALREQVQIEYAGTDEGQRIIEEYELLTTPDPPRRTQADHDDNRRSLNRKLDERLFLIFKRDREKHTWQFPKKVHADADPKDYIGKFYPGLRETGEDGVTAYAGPNLKGFYYSHAPQGFYYYKYPTPQGNSFGAKVFFYRVRYLKGPVKLGKGITDFAWVSRSELEEYLDPATFKFVRQMV